MINHKNFEPQCVDDCVIGSAVAKLTLQDIIEGKMAFPAYGKCGILIYGVWGTGKTALAGVIPNAMEFARGGSDPHVKWLRCGSNNNGTATVEKIVTQTEVISFNNSGLHYVVLDEVDNLTEAAQKHLKSAMNFQHAVFIMTTNHLNKVDKGVQSRCHLIQMNAAQPADWLPKVRQVIAACGAPVPDDSLLLPVIQAAQGSARDVMSGAQAVANQILRKLAA